jgi:histidinol-phosphate aminotransferase
MNRGLAEITPYVGGTHKEDAIRKYGVKDPVKLSSNENALGVSPAAVESAEGALLNGNIYPEGSNRALRETIAGKFDLDPENIFVGNGADEIIYYTAMSLINDGDEVIIPALTFPIYTIAFRTMRATIVTSSMKGLSINTADILDRITDKTKVIALCNPNNPTGHALGREEVHRFVERVPKEVLILMDEAYMDFAEQETFPDSISLFKQGADNLSIVRTLSKAYGIAGFRVGYGIADPGLTALMNRIKLPFNVSIVSQAAALGALSDDEFLFRTIENTKEGRMMIYSAMKELGLEFVESSSNFILIHTGTDGNAVTEELMKRGVIVRSARNYGLPGSIRVTVGTRDQNDRFIRAMKDIYTNR